VLPDSKAADDPNPNPNPNPSPIPTQVNSLHVLPDGVHVLSGDRRPATTLTLSLSLSLTLNP